MIQFPSKATASERFILLMFLIHDRNKKKAAYYSNVGVRRSQYVVKKYDAFLETVNANFCSH